MKKTVTVFISVILLIIMTSSAFAYTYGEYLLTFPWGKSKQDIIDAEQATDYKEKKIGDIIELSFSPEKNMSYQYYLADDKLIAGSASAKFVGQKKDGEQRVSMLFRNMRDMFGDEWQLSKKEINTLLSDRLKESGLSKLNPNTKKYNREQKVWLTDNALVFLFLSKNFESKMFYFAPQDVVEKYIK